MVRRPPSGMACIPLSTTLSRACFIKSRSTFTGSGIVPISRAFDRHAVLLGVGSREQGNIFEQAAEIDFYQMQIRGRA